MLEYKSTLQGLVVFENTNSGRCAREDGRFDVLFGRIGTSRPLPVRCDCRVEGGTHTMSFPQL